MVWDWVKDHLIEIVIVLVLIGLAIWFVVVYIIPQFLEPGKNQAEFESLCNQWNIQYKCDPKLFADFPGATPPSRLHDLCSKLYPLTPQQSSDPQQEPRLLLDKCLTICKNGCNPMGGSTS